MGHSTFCIIIRVFNRVDDLRICIDLIRKFWIRNEYYVLIVSNGKYAGFDIPEEIRNAADNIIDLAENIGHLEGDQRLLKAGLQFIPDSCEYTILLQADTWIFDDELIDKYTTEMKNSSSVWSSAEWVEKYWSLAIDFAIAKTDFIKSNSGILDFEKHPEAWVCDYLMENGYKFLYIKECMPVHIPKFLRDLYNAYGGRFRSFPEAKMVTHHIEDLEGGIEEKMLLANICLGRKEFNIGDEAMIASGNRKLKKLIKLGMFLPRSKWFGGKKHRRLESRVRKGS